MPYEKKMKESDLAEHIAKKLKLARHLSGLTQEELAQKMKTSRTQISRMESGKALPTMRAIFKYSKATGQKIRLKVIP